MDIEAEMSQRATPLVHGTNIPHLINDREAVAIGDSHISDRART